MIINELLEKNNMTRYSLSKQSGVPLTTVTDICSGKAQLDKCAALTLYKIAKTLGVSVEFLLEYENDQSNKQRSSFEVFKSDTCHRVKDLGDINFIIQILQSDEIRTFYNCGWYKESFYLLGMIDYLSKENGLPLCTNYNDIRSKRLAKPVFPLGVITLYKATGDESVKKQAIKNAIPEFMRFNIVEGEVRDVC